jgi:peptide/nickel transport system permease protein
MKRAFRNLKRTPNLLVGAFIIMILIAIAIFAPWLAPYHPIDDANLMNAEVSPSRTFLLGTDRQGRDVLSRIIYGSRISLSVGLLCQLLNSVIGIILGLIAGYFGKWLDDLVMGITNIMLSIPPLIFAMAIMAVLGPGLFNVFLAIGLTNWTYECRITRSQVLSAISLDYVTAARALGYGRIRIMFEQILPNIVGPILVISSLGVGYAILIEAALSFLGLGAQPPTPSWGAMLSTARDELFVAPWTCIFPGLAIFITILSLNLFGDGLRDILDPYSLTSRR